MRCLSTVENLGFSTGRPSGKSSWRTFSTGNWLYSEKDSHHPRYTPPDVVPDARIVEVGIRRAADSAADVAWLAGAKDRSADTLKKTT